MGMHPFWSFANCDLEESFCTTLSGILTMLNKFVSLCLAACAGYLLHPPAFWEV
jgi:hypothetical protein